MRITVVFVAGMLLSAGMGGPAGFASSLPGPAPGQDSSEAQDDAPLSEVTISAPEPRYVAPTLRDRLGRIWAPVLINDRGPYRLVLDTGASHSAIIASVAGDLGLEPIAAGNVLLHGTTGSAMVATVRVESLRVGDLQLAAQALPLVPDALGGAQGVLGMAGMRDKRIFIDFLHDNITITRSRGARAAPGFITVPVRIDSMGLLRADIHIGSVRALAIIDTGGQVSVGNLALEAQLLRRHADDASVAVTITGTTLDDQSGQSHALPPISLGSATIRNAQLTFSDLRIFDVWKLSDTPTLIIGMDALGLVDTLIIDYRRQELQIRTR